MTSIEAWLQRQAAREQRVVTLEDALLSNQARSYARYRLRYFGVRCLSSALLHGIRLTFLQYIFSHRTFLTALVLNAVVGVMTSFWWGALEVLRGRVRHLSRDAQHRRIPGEIGQWLTVAAILAVLSLLAPMGWIAWELSARGHSVDVLHLYVFAVCVRLAADLMTLTFHSGVYAVRRVYRPLPAMVAVELASVLVVLALWPWLGRWSFPVAVLLSTGVSASLIVHYAARLYRLFGWLPLRLARPQFAQFARWRTLKELFSAGASYAVMKMDAFLMLAMFHSRTHPANGITLFILFVSIGPAVQAGFDWAQLLYFDLKRLDAACLRALRRRYERLAVRLAWAVGIALWGLACVLGTAITRRNLGAVYWLLAPFFLSRSLLALAQIQAFSRRRYGVLLASGALLLASMFSLQAGISIESYKLLGLAGTCLLVTWILGASAGRSQDDDFDRRVLPLTEWLQCLQEVRQPVRVRSLRFRTETTLHLQAPRGVRAWAEGDHWRHRRMAQRVARKIRGFGAVTLLHPGCVAWYEVANAPVRLSRQTLLSWGGGLLTSFVSSGFEPDGVMALRTALKMQLLGGVLRNWRRPSTGSRTAQEVKETFATLVPQGVTYAPDERPPELLNGLSSRQRRRVLFEAVHFAQHLHASPRNDRFDVTSFCMDGELRLIFVIDRRCDRRQRARWRTLVTEMNVTAALAGRQSPATLERSAGTVSRPSRTARASVPL